MQADFPGFISPIEVSPISSNRIEIEQKYKFATLGIEQTFAAKEKLLAEHFRNENPAILRFNGNDYYFIVRSGRKTTTLRYRTGFPVNYRMCMKIETAQRVVRKENEFHVRDGTDLERVLDYHRSIACIGDSYIELPINVRGYIRNISLNNGTKQVIEVVICVATNIQTGAMVVSGEIEAHNFTDIDEAKQVVNQYEHALGWKKYRTNKRMWQLVNRA